MNTMQDYDIDHDTEDTLSLSSFLIESDQLPKPNHSSKSTSSSSSPSLSEKDFAGFYNQEWSNNNTSSENIVFCGKVVSSRNPETTKQMSTFLRSNSDSFRFFRLKTASRRRAVAARSYSMPNRSELFPCKKRLMVFMFGSGSSKFPTKVDMSVIKSRQLQQQSTSVDGGKEESDHRGKSGKKWWRLVDVLGCSCGYEKDTVGFF